jgi:hypothetical protein
LINFVRNSQSNARIRVVTLTLLCEYADRDSAEQILGLMDSLVVRLSNGPNHHDPEFYALPGLVLGFLKEGAKPLSTHLENPARLLGSVSKVILLGACSRCKARRL